MLLTSEKRVIFQTHGFDLSAENPLEVRMPENYDALHFIEQGSDIVLQGGAPGTHLVELTVNLQGKRVSAAVVFSSVLTKEDIRSNRFYVPTPTAYGICGAVRTGDDMPKESMGLGPITSTIGFGRTLERREGRSRNGKHPQATSLGNPGGDTPQQECERVWGEMKAQSVTSEASKTVIGVEEHIKTTAPQDLKMLDGGARPIRICFIGSLTRMDGQKDIWLQQADRLPRSRFFPIYLTFESDVPENEEPSTISPLLSLPTSSTPHVVEDRLQRAGVPLIRAPIPPVAAEDIDAYFTFDHQTCRIEGGGGQMEERVEAVYCAVLESIRKAPGRDPALMQPAWARRVFGHLVDAIEHVKPDVLVVGNSRSLGDAVLTRAARYAMGPHGKIVMEFPNINPRLGIDVDLMVAPSHYVALHEGTSALADETGARLVVIPPGVVISPPLVKTTTAASVHVVDAPSGHIFENGRQMMLPLCHPDCTHVLPGTRGCNRACQVVGFAGRMAPEKGPGLFLLIAKEVAAIFPFARFVMIGDGPLRHTLESMTQRLGIESLVQFTGWASKDQLPRLMGGLDVFLNPSLTNETFGIANVEAMAVGVPVISFGLGGAMQYLSHNVNSMVIDDPAPRAVANAVAQLLEDKSHRKALGERARADVEANFGVEAMVKRWTEAYEMLVGGQQTW
ncbi:unnamed protein product [Choristocarpus tenellus]